MQRTLIPADYEAAIGFLMARIDYERTVNVPYSRRNFKLDRMRELLDRLGNPQSALRIVHIAGTKGKGSTAAMIAAVLTAAGYRSGLYTSPHLDQVEERMCVDGQPCSANELVELVKQIQPAVVAMDKLVASQSDTDALTYFEILTALALLHFVRRQVDVAVLEVGMGGRLDSTNVCQPDVSVITSISYDHMRQLGNTLAAIAGEKAGIIKSGIPVVSGVLEDEPRKVIENTAHQRGCRLVQLGRDFTFDYLPAQHLEAASSRPRMDFHLHKADRERSFMGLELGLIGQHQAANAAVALAALDELQTIGITIPATAVHRGLADVNWPARMEVLGRHPTVIVDAAHNVASVEAFVSTIDLSFTTNNRILIFATTRDKDVRGMLQILLPRFNRTIFTRYSNNPRGVPVDELVDLAVELGNASYQVADDPAAAWEMARAMATPDSLIGITGSFFIAAEMRSFVQAQSRLGTAR